jgi:hypothetical protein
MWITFEKGRKSQDKYKTGIKLKKNEGCTTAGDNLWIDGGRKIENR